MSSTDRQSTFEEDLAQIEKDLAENETKLASKVQELCAHIESGPTWTDILIQLAVKFLFWVLVVASAMLLVDGIRWVIGNKDFESSRCVASNATSLTAISTAITYKAWVGFLPADEAHCGFATAWAVRQDLLRPALKILAKRTVLALKQGQSAFQHIDGLACKVNGVSAPFFKGNAGNGLLDVPNNIHGSSSILVVGEQVAGVGSHPSPATLSSNQAHREG